MGSHRKPKKKPQPAHVTFGGEGYRCLNCGTEQAVGMAPIKVWEAWGESFMAQHRACAPSPEGAARFAYKDEREWVRSWDTGISSLTIHTVLSGRGAYSGNRSGFPRDPADFGRCYRLLKVAPPEWRARLGEVATENPEGWSRLVPAWDELTALYEEELPTGEAPKLYARMQELIEASRKELARG